jgi:hypothetical protein
VASAAVAVAMMSIENDAPVSTQAFPAIAELKTRAYWVAWRYVKTADGKTTKVPTSPHTGRNAQTNNPATWGTYVQAMERASRDNLPGVGYVLTADKDITGIDLDRVRNADTGELAPWAAEVVALAETYTEVSPSGTGLRLFCRGKVDGPIKCDPANVEVYGNGRYLTVTGNHLDGTPTEIRHAPKTEAILRKRVETFKLASSELEALMRRHAGEGIEVDNFFSKVSNLALTQLDAWVPSLFGDAAKFQQGTGAWRVSSKALGRDLEEDLSLAPNGIRDFGTEVGHRAIDIVIKYGARKNAAAAALWLCERMGADPKTLGWHGPVVAKPAAPTLPNKLMQTSAEFVAGFVPPDYLIDGLLQRRYVYSFTAPTGSGKTAVALRIAAHVANALPLGDREVERGRVLMFAGENPDDVRTRWIKLCEQMQVSPDSMGVVFMPFTPTLADADIRKRIDAEASQHGPFSLLIVDTSAAYYSGNDENDNVALGNHARMLRTFVDLPGGPTILVTCHPTKTADMTNLLPRGGGAFLAEVDGNLVAIKERGSMAVEISTHGKFRGPEFAPFSFKLIPATSDKLVDSKGRAIWTVFAEPITDTEKEALEQRGRTDQDEVLRAMLKTPGASTGELANFLGWVMADGKPYKMRVHRVIKELTKHKLVEQRRDGQFVLTGKGEAEAEKIGEFPPL